MLDKYFGTARGPGCTDFGPRARGKLGGILAEGCRPWVGIVVSRLQDLGPKATSSSLNSETLLD